MDLFDAAEMENASGRPLADRMRPRALEEFYGQNAILGEGKILRKSIQQGRVFSMLFWGPPGTGKSTLAKIIATKCRCRFVPMSAVSAGVKEIKELAKEARDNRKYANTATILFLDEIHRFSRSQQDYLLPHVEDGTLTLIGATTENPSFEINSALLSRLRVFILEPLTDEEIEAILQRAVSDATRGLGKLALTCPNDVLGLISHLSHGDARCALNILELASREALAGTPRMMTRDHILEAAQKTTLIYDKKGEQHYNLISALHKSLRDSDPDAGLYWLGRMLEGGEDPLFIARRLVRFASEDVGLASPKALEQAVAGYQACQFVGMPECSLALAQVVVFLATAPKSNALEKGYILVKEEIERSGHLPAPLHLRNAPTKLMKDVGYGEGYQYAHDLPDAVVAQEHLPEPILGKRFYEPTDRGFEQTIKERMEVIRRKKEELISPKGKQRREVD